MLSLTACATSGTAAPSPEASPAHGSGTDAAVTDAGVSAVQSSPTWVRLVTMGDAYTAGSATDAPRRDSWPAQLAEAFKRRGMRMWVKNLAANNKTSGRVLEEQLPRVASEQPDVVTLQVGVNDILFGETESYGDNVGAILEELLTFMPPERVFVITTPDHTLTGWGDAYAPVEVGHAAVTEINETLREEAGAREVSVIDIGQVNGLVAIDNSLVIDEGPDPTAKQYAGWVELIGHHVERALATLDP